MGGAFSRQDLWPPSPERPILMRNEVHLWRACLAPDPYLVTACLSILSPDERHRASKYYFQRDREQFLIARGVLRDVLSRYLDISPHHIRFSYNEYGKPQLIDRIGDAPLSFSVSHTNGLALYAITRGRAIALDIERVREIVDLLEIGKRFFSATEVSMLLALPSHLRTAAFFNCC